MRFSQAYLDELFARTSIADVVGKRVVWDKRKSNPARGDLWACCPFHGEKTPSFHVEESKGRFYCFGCQEKGNAIDFVMKLDRLSFPEAVELLAAEAGLPPPPRDARAPAREAAAKGVLDALEAAAAFFERELRGPRGRAARDALIARGLPEGEWARFRLGYAPDSREALKSALEQKGVAVATQTEAGLLAVPDDGRAPYDRFRDRIMFPIADARGRVIAFGGRAMAKDAPAKYLNSPEGPAFSKGRVLYRVGAAREALARRGPGQARPLIVAEGYMDVIALERAGYPAVAPLGTAITQDQIRLLWKLHPEPIVCLDGDKAGQAAASRALDRALPLLEPGRSLRFVVLPGGKDPDDLLREQGPGALAQALTGAAALVDALWARERDAEPLDTPERRANLKKRLRAAADQIANPDVREAYRQELDRRLADLFPRAAPRRAGGRRDGPPPRDLRPATSELKSMAAARAPAAPARLREIVLAPLANPGLLSEGEDAFAALTIPDGDLDTLRNALLQVWNPGIPSLDKDDVRRHLDRCGATGALAALETADLTLQSAYAADSPDAAARWRAALSAWEIDQDLARAAADARGGDAAALARLARLKAARAALPADAAD